MFFSEIKRKAEPFAETEAVGQMGPVVSRSVLIVFEAPERNKCANEVQSQQRSMAHNAVPAPVVSARAKRSLTKEAKKAVVWSMRCYSDVRPNRTIKIEGKPNMEVHKPPLSKRAVIFLKGFVRFHASRWEGKPEWLFQDESEQVHWPKPRFH